MNTIATTQEMALPFNTQSPSTLPASRINELNTLAIKATAVLNRNEQVSEHNLIIETHAIKEVYESVLEATTGNDFYRNIDSAFKALIGKNPDQRSSVFQTYTDLISMLRIIESNRSTLEHKFQEAAATLNDIDTLDGENLNRIHN
jgi:hypothetical protein